MSTNTETFAGTKEFYRAHALLQGAAERRELLRYLDIGCVLGFTSYTLWMGVRTGQLLDAINQQEHHDGRPLLSALVIKKAPRLPGEGFFTMATQMGLYDPNEDKWAFWRRELAQVYAEWSTTEGET